MAATVNVNNRTVVHKGSNGVATAPGTDVCNTPTPAGPVPTPYPNVAMSTDAAGCAKKVKIDGNPAMISSSNFSTSTGDEAGNSPGGLVSSKFKGKAEFVAYSFDVKIEGKGVPRLGDLMVQNKGGAPNTPPMPEVQPPVVGMATGADNTDVKLVSIEFYDE